jgi:hypothetical protein
MAGDPAGEHWRGERARRGRGPIALLAGLALCAATLLVYLPTPGDYWIRYDNELWLRAPRVEALTLTGAERVEALVEMFTTPHGDLYQPLMTFSIALDYKLFGENRAGYHAHAIALHLAIVLGVFALALRLSGALLASFLATLLIALHPILVETASWVIHRTILTAMGWIVVASHAYLSYARDPRRWPWLGVATAAFALSLLGKSVPSVALLPFAIDLWLGRHVSVRVVAEKLPLIAAVLLVTGLNLHFSQAIVDAEVVARPFAAVVAEAPAALVLSAANLVWPSDLAIFYAAGQSWSLIGTRWIAVALAAVAVALGGAALWRRGVRGPLLCAALWIAFLAPYLLAGAYRDTSTADRYAYMGTLLLVPGVAAALAQLAGASAAIRSSARAWGVGLVVLALALPLGVQARALARRWSDEVLLWQVVIARSPHPTAFGAMGNAYRARLDWPAAVDAYERALALLPNEPIASLRGVYHLTAARYALAAYDVSKRRGEASAGDPEHYLDVALRAARDGAARWPPITIGRGSGSGWRGAARATRRAPRRRFAKRCASNRATRWRSRSSRTSIGSRGATPRRRMPSSPGPICGHRSSPRIAASSRPSPPSKRRALHRTRHGGSIATSSAFPIPRTREPSSSTAAPAPRRVAKRRRRASPRRRRSPLRAKWGIPRARCEP